MTALCNQKKTSVVMLSVFLTVVATSITPASAFGTIPMFTQQKAMQLTTPSKTDGVEIELPNFEELFGRIAEVSPLARLAIEGGEGGIDVAHKKYPSDLKWKKVEANKKRVVHRVDKIDNFQNLGCPVARFQSTINVPMPPQAGLKFAEFIMHLEERAKWDPQIEDVRQIYPIYDVDAANIAMDFKYGDCKLLGIGYCQTKSNPLVDGREQLILCGIQELPNKGWVIWGTELEEWHNHLFPQDRPRHTRAKSHLFSTTIMPTGPESFDVEYILQLEVGGNLPTFLTTPVMVETIKSMFNHADKIFNDEEHMAAWTESQGNMDNIIDEKHGLLMPL